MEQPSHCLNCGAPLHGPYCYECGQPVKGMVRHLRSVVHDFLDTVFEYDSRIWRSLLPLYFRPGQITNEFLAGKRSRFVLPFRLFFVLTVVAFLVLQLTAEPARIDGSGTDFSLTQTTTPAEVIERRDEALARLSATRQSTDSPAATAALDEVERYIRKASRERIAWLEQAEAARAEGREPPPEDWLSLSFNGEPWDAESNPLRVEWLPQAANDQLNRWVERANRNLRLARDEPGRLLSSFLGLLPAALFVLMPIFALLLKLFYVGKRWLYMAHLVVALHSHSFLALALLVSVLLEALADLATGLSWIEPPLRFTAAVSRFWVPVYLLLMQRRVYAESWPVTVVKYGSIGTIYLVLVSFTMVAVAAISLIVA